MSVSEEQASRSSTSVNLHLVNVNHMIEIFSTRFGDLAIGCHQGVVCLCDWTSSRRYQGHLAALKKKIPAIETCHEDDRKLFEAVVRWIEMYLEGSRELPAFKIGAVGTEFQKTVWRQISAIPYGETLTYSGLASAIGCRSAIRAVASACASNPVSLLVPCHRVIGADGSITGYAGGLAVKASLLQLEHPGGINF